MADSSKDGRLEQQEWFLAVLNQKFQEQEQAIQRLGVVFSICDHLSEHFGTCLRHVSSCVYFVRKWLNPKGGLDMAGEY